jgi:hypothetical protein
MRDICCKCGDANTFYSLKGDYPLCTKCYLAWEESPEAKEFKQKFLVSGKPKPNLYAYFERWLNREKPEMVQFT